jgi:hypothetical protein
MNQEIKVDAAAVHPGDEPGAWESMSIVGGTQAEHDFSVAAAIGAGWSVWADDSMGTDEGDVPAAYLLRELK